MEKITKKEAFEDYFESYYDEWDINEKIEWWNKYQEQNRGEDSLYNMCELDELVSVEGKSVTEVFGMFSRPFNECDDYFYFHVYGIKSTSEPEKIISYIDMEDYLIEEFEDNEDFFEWLADEYDLEAVDELDEEEDEEEEE